MRINRIKQLTLVLIAIFATTIYSLDFEMGGIRNFSLGRTGIASSNDLSAAAYNPALLVENGTIELLTDSRLYMYDLENDDLSYNFFAIGFPLGKIGYPALSMNMFSANLYQESRVGLHWGLPLLDSRLALGLSLNYFTVGYDSNEFTANDPFFEDNSNNTSAIDFDLGAKYDYSRKLRFGFTARNLLQADLAIDESNEELLPQEFGAGVMFKPNDKLMLTCDLNLKQNSQIDESNVEYALGTEYQLYDTFYLRSGLNNNDLSVGFGYKVIDKKYVKSFRNPFTSDKMVESKNVVLSIDYGFSYPAFSDLEIPYGNHFVGISFKFGSSTVNESALVNHVAPKIETSILEVPVSALKDDYEPAVLIDTVYVEKFKNIYIEKIVRDTVYVIDTVEVIIGVPESEYNNIIKELEVANMKIRGFRTNNKALIHITNATKYYYSGDYEKAIKECKSAIKIAPDMALAYIKLGSVYYRQGKQDLAMQSWRKAKQLDPNNPELKALFK